MTLRTAAGRLAPSEQHAPTIVLGLVAATLVAQLAAVSSVAVARDVGATARWFPLVALTAVSLVVADRPRPPVALTAFVLLALGSTVWSIDREVGGARAAGFAMIVWSAFAAGAYLRRCGRLGSLVRVMLAVNSLTVALSVIRLVVDPEGAALRDELRGVVENANGFGIVAAVAIVCGRGELLEKGAARSAALLMVPGGVLLGLAAARSAMLLVLVAISLVDLGSGNGRRLLANAGLLVVTAVAIGLAEPAITPRERTPASAAVASDAPGANEITTTAGPSTVTPDLGADTSTTAAAPVPTTEVTAAEETATTVRNRGATIFGTHRARGQSWIRAVSGARDEAWAASVHIIRRRPLLGHGFGTGDMLFTRYDAPLYWFQGANPANSYIQAGMELGIVGIALLVVAAVRVIAVSVAAVRKCGSPSVNTLAGLAVGGLVIAIVESLLTAPGAPWALLTWLAAGAVMGRASASMTARPLEINQ